MYGSRIILHTTDFWDLWCSPLWDTFNSIAQDTEVSFLIVLKYVRKHFWKCNWLYNLSYEIKRYFKLRGFILSRIKTIIHWVNHSIMFRALVKNTRNNGKYKCNFNLLPLRSSNKYIDKKFWSCKRIEGKEKVKKEQTPQMLLCSSNEKHNP